MPQPLFATLPSRSAASLSEEVNAWLRQALRPASCSDARIVQLPPWHAGIGSALMMFASFALLAIEYNYTVVASGSWKFALGLSPPTHEFFFEPLGSCQAEARQRKPTDVPICTDHVCSDLITMLHKGVRTIRVLNYVSKAQRLNIPLPQAALLPRTSEFLAASGLTFLEVHAHVLRLLLLPRPWLRAQLESVAPPVALAEAGVHVRTSELGDDCGRDGCRGRVPLDSYANVLKQLDVGSLFVASDVNSTAARLGTLVPARVSIAHRDTYLLPEGTMAEKAADKLTPQQVKALTGDALVDMLLLARAPYFVGTESSWLKVVLSLRLLRGAEHFGRSAAVGVLSASNDTEFGTTHLRRGLRFDGSTRAVWSNSTAFAAYLSSTLPFTCWQQCTGHASRHGLCVPCVTRHCPGRLHHYRCHCGHGEGRWCPAMQAKLEERSGSLPSCSVRMLKQTSVQSPCTPGKTFGCQRRPPSRDGFAAAVWVRKGCRGHFEATLAGTRSAVQCGRAGQKGPEECSVRVY